MIIASSDEVFNKSKTVNAVRQKEPKLATCGSFDLAPESCYGTYCICNVHEGAMLGKYTANRRSDEEEPFRQLCESQLTTVKYPISFLAKNETISVDSHWVNTGTA
jgi:hypothetical protein